jgi:alpha-N-arabinofuranosidase
VKWDKKGSSTQFDEEQYFSTMQTALKMEELVTKHSEIMNKYDPNNKIALVVDEWGGWYNVEPGTNPGFLYQQNTMRDAMIAGTTLNIFNNHSKRVKMANLAQTVNVLQAVILTEGDKILLTPTYHVMKMYNVHQDAQLIPVEISSPLYIFNGKTLPAISVSASKDKKGLTHISLVNIDASKENTVEIDMNELGIQTITGTILSSSKLQNHNTFDNPNTIIPKAYKNFEMRKNKLIIKIPAFSVLVLEGN